LPDQDTGVNLEEEESRMMARLERGAPPAAPMPADAPCISEMPFRQKARRAPACQLAEQAYDPTVLFFHSTMKLDSGYCSCIPAGMQGYCSSSIGT
jgi:hypothetical protein